ncbi:MAG: hypothetical protein ACRC46_03985 [Thermoguttaceae bacterium]
MTKTILGSFVVAALVSGTVYAAPCDDVVACNPCDDLCATPKRSKLKVYADAAALIGCVSGGYANVDGNYRRFTAAGGVKATLGLELGKNAVEFGYTGLYNNLSTTAAAVGDPISTDVLERNRPVLANFNAVDMNFVHTLERNKNLKVFAGIGYANFSETTRDNTSWYSNDLAGIHVGGKWGRDFGTRFGIETYGKFGVYANTLTFHLHSDGKPDSHQTGNARGGWVAAGGVNLTCQLTNRVKAFAGFDATMLEGLDRLNTAARTSDLPDNNVIVRGLVLGVKAAF